MIRLLYGTTPRFQCACVVLRQDFGSAIAGILFFSFIGQVDCGLGYGGLGTNRWLVFVLGLSVFFSRLSLFLNPLRVRKPSDASHSCEQTPQGNKGQGAMCRRSTVFGLSFRLTAGRRLFCLSRLYGFARSVDDWKGFFAFAALFSKCGSHYPPRVAEKELDAPSPQASTFFLPLCLWELAFPYDVQDFLR